MTLELFKDPLTTQVKIYIPSVDCRGERLNREQVQARLRRLHDRFTRMFGGCTSYKALGSWSSGDGTITTEPVQTVESYCTPEQLEANESELYYEARQMRDKLNQEAVSVEINHKLYFV